MQFIMNQLYINKAEKKKNLQWRNYKKLLLGLTHYVLHCDEM